MVTIQSKRKLINCENTFPKISVFMISFNHEELISQAIESVLSQIHDYSFEIIIGDDCSTDRTKEIIETYRIKYPEIVKPLFNKRNIGASRNGIKVLENCSGEYIAMLDGDDRWNDPLKLKKQIEFLDNHQDYVLSCHRYYKYLLDEQRFDEDYMWSDFFLKHPDGFTLDSEKFYSHWFTQTLTVVFRRSALDVSEIKSYKHFKDVHLIYSLLKRGKGYVHSFFGAVYNIHRKGIWNGMDELSKIKNDFHTLDEIIKRDGKVNHLTQIHFDKLNILALHESKYKWKLKIYNLRQLFRKILGADKSIETKSA